MSRFTAKHARTTMQWLTTGLGTLSALVIAYGFFAPGVHAPGEMGTLEGRLLPAHSRGVMQWVTITTNQMHSGATIPANTNTIIEIPDTVTRITRHTLFGRRGQTVRYWGYCFPANYEEARQNTMRGFPGKLFLSEAEREYRRRRLVEERRRTFSIFENLTNQDLNETQNDLNSLIRHELDIFKGGTSCYVMSESTLPVGTDEDGDGLNSALERAYGTDPRVRDTDADGIEDGLEVFGRTGTSPTKRDSDGDGIIDGIEDANRNGRFDPGETNPMAWDTDRDGLCDGLCIVNRGRELRGEDKNVNGIYEPELGETDPRRADSLGDGVLDGHRVYLCMLEGGTDC